MIVLISTRIFNFTLSKLIIMKIVDNYINCHNCVNLKLKYTLIDGHKTEGPRQVIIV